MILRDYLHQTLLHQSLNNGSHEPYLHSRLSTTWPTTIRGPHGDATSRPFGDIRSTSTPLDLLHISLVYLEPHDSDLSYISYSDSPSQRTFFFLKITLLIIINNTLLYNNLAYDLRRISFFALRATFTPFSTRFLSTFQTTSIILSDSETS